jgi:tRNA A37 threonylcarbamoyladenosine modification protein TsaB
VVGVTTGEALAAALPPEQRAGRAVWAAVDNRRGRVVLERFKRDGSAAAGEGPGVFSLDELPPAGGARVVLAGDAAEAVAERLLARGDDALLSAVRLPDAAGAARVAALRLAGRLAPLPARPLYAEPPAVRPPSGTEAARRV